MSLNNFTAKQLHTYNRIQQLEAELADTFDPSLFVLNPQTSIIINQIVQLQNDCDHQWEGNICKICNKTKMEDHNA